MMKNLYQIAFAAFLITSPGLADDWTRFRGPDGAGISRNSHPPAAWSDTNHLAWKTALPGPGSSSPIVLGDRILLTCYSGYGVESESPQSIEALQRHLVCVNRRDGKILWSKTIAAEQPEDSYTGFLKEHGYASNTPVTDGQRVYAFFGKTGVFAFDLEGEQLWKTDVGKESSNRRWGSGSSLILHGDKLIVNAAEESQSLRALETATGKEIWKAEAALFELAFTTPAIVPVGDGNRELVMPVPGEVWGLDPDTGKLKWYIETSLTGNITPMPIWDADNVYIFGGFRGSGSMAFRAGGKDDARSNVVWTSRESSYVATPLLYKDHLYWVDDNGQAHCVHAKTGQQVYRERLRTRGGGRPFYASLVLADEKLFAVSRRDGTFVLAAQPTFKQLAVNSFASDKTDFNATPAIAGDQMFLRSNQFLYCISP